MRTCPPPLSSQRYKLNSHELLSSAIAASTDSERTEPTKFAASIECARQSPTSQRNACAQPAANATAYSATIASGRCRFSPLLDGHMRDISMLPISQPPPQAAHHAIQASSFKSGICGCFSDMRVCLMGCACPCLLYGDNYHRIHGQGSCGSCLIYGFCPCLAFIFAGENRTHLRVKYNLHEEPMSDCCLHCWCSSCALCQEAREMKSRSSVIVGA